MQLGLTTRAAAFQNCPEDCGAISTLTEGSAVPVRIASRDADERQLDMRL